MTMAGKMTNDPRPRRFVIVAGCYADAGPAIGLAAALARDLRGALFGVLAQEPATAAAEGAPVLTKRLRVTGNALTREGLTLAYAADARAFSTRLAVVAEQARLSWDFRTDTGMIADLAWRLREPGDTVLVGYRRLLPTDGPVVALCRADDTRTRDLAAALARALGRRVLTLPIESAGDPERIEQLSATALIVAPEAARQATRLAALIEAARCPVLIAPDNGD